MQYVKNKNFDTHLSRPVHNLPADEMKVLVISDPIAMLLYSEKCFWICIGEINNIKIDGDLAPFIPLSMLDEDIITISYQILGLCPATSNGDPDQNHNWRTYIMQEHSFMSFRLWIQPSQWYCLLFIPKFCPSCINCKHLLRSNDISPQKYLTSKVSQRLCQVRNTHIARCQVSQCQ